jgi:hypothetical protein
MLLDSLIKYPHKNCEDEICTSDSGIDRKEPFRAEMTECIWPSGIKEENGLCYEDHEDYKPDFDWKLTVEPYVELVRLD